MPESDKPTPIGALRDAKTGGLMTMATAATAERPDLQPAPKPAARLPGWVAGALGLLTLLAAAPGAIAASMVTGGLAVPAFITTAAAIGGGLAPFLGGFAFWAAGGNPLDLVKPRQAEPSPRVGPPEP